MGQQHTDIHRPWRDGPRHMSLAYFLNSLYVARRCRWSAPFMLFSLETTCFTLGIFKKSTKVVFHTSLTLLHRPKPTCRARACPLHGQTPASSTNRQPGRLIGFVTGRGLVQLWLHFETDNLPGSRDDPSTWVERRPAGHSVSPAASVSLADTQSCCHRGTDIPSSASSSSLCRRAVEPSLNPSARLQVR